MNMGMKIPNQLSRVLSTDDHSVVEIGLALCHRLINTHMHLSLSICVDPELNMKCFRCELQAPLFFKYDYDSSMTFFLLETFAYQFCVCVLDISPLVIH